MGDVEKGLKQLGGAVYDPLNLSGQGGVPGVNTGGRGVLGDAYGRFSGEDAKDRAIEAQTEGAKNANEVLLGEYGKQNELLQPYQQAGSAALSSLVGNDFMKNYQQDPGYQFRLDEGNKAINSAAAARGMGNSGATLKALTRYGQDYATNEYNNVYNREYGRLSNLAGIGQNATNNAVNVSGNYGNTVSGNHTGLGNARASAEIAQQNQLNSYVEAGIGGGVAYATGGKSKKPDVVSSDERLKTDITPIPKEQLSEMKSFLKAFYFKYKDEIRGEGTWPGIIAQDLEKSELGRTLVIEDEKGFKCVDVKKLMSMFLATMAEA